MKVKQLTGARKAGNYEDEHGEQQPFYTPVREEQEVEDLFVKLYFGAWKVLARCSGIGQDLFFFLCEQMEEDNMVIFNKKAREEFLEERYEYRETYNDKRTVYNATLELKKKGLIRSLDSNCYQINPVYAHKGTKQLREDLIKANTEWIRK